MTKSLLLKGLAGVAAVGGAAAGGLVFYGKEIFGGKKVEGANETAQAQLKNEEKNKEDLSKFTHKELIEKAGLSCGLTDEETEITGNSTKDCTVKEGLTLRVKVGQKEEEGITFTTSGSEKLKVSRSEEVGGEKGTDKYNKKLKFVVDSGDISLTKGSSSPTNIQKLEQFETYEIKKEGDKFYLSRKTDAKEEKMKALGLSKCTLPGDTGSSECTLTTPEDIKTVKFENQADGVTVSSGSTVNLKISKMSNSTDFTDGYRFTFTFPQDLTIDSKTIKTNIPYDYKIKKGTGNALTLEKAWADDNTFTKKAGLDCNSNPSECNVPAEPQKLNVKVGNQKKTGISSKSGTGKIKREADQPGYNQGLKFTITTGDVTLTGGEGGSISTLSELETYEITEEDGKYYLTRKTSKEEGIRSSLGLPEGCNLPSTDSVNCDISTNDFQKINFKDKSSSSATEKVTLTISKADTTDFPLGYKFTFNTTADATIKTNEKIKANIPTDFKIKKQDGKAVSLEKAWTETKFAEKVGLNCTTEECCTKTAGGTVNINVKKGTDKKEGITNINGSGKIKVEKEQAGYNQGLKFTITTADVSLTGGNKTSGTDFTSLGELETYEITEEGGKYYLTRKNEASENIARLLGLPSTCKLSSSTSSCSNLSAQDLQKINFSDKDSGKPTFSSGTATLTISKTSDTTKFPLGYKFALNSGQEITFKETNKVAANTNTEFKIKKSESSPTTLTLEKAWSNFSFAEKAGLTCTTQSGSDTCCTKSNGTVNVKKGDDKKEGISSINGSNKGKIKVEKEQAGYNQGLKFTITGGDVTLTGGTESKTDGSQEDLTKLEEYETYEIKESGGKYYLTRKHESIVFIKKQLGIEGFCNNDNTWTRANSKLSFSCDIKNVDHLKKINFDNKSGHTNWGSGTIDVQLSIENDSSNGGFKATFSGSTSNVCLPTGTSGGSAKIATGGLVYKINKGNGNGSWCLVKDGGSSGGQCTT